MEILKVKYKNWLDDYVELELKPLGEVASFEEIVELKTAEKSGDGDFVFEKTMELFKKAFVDEKEVEYFLSHNVETVFSTLEAWLEKSQEERQKAAYKRLYESLVESGDLEDNIEDNENTEEKIVKTKSSIKQAVKSLVFFSGLTLFVLLSIIYSWGWAAYLFLGISGFFAFISLLAVVFNKQLNT
jgi:hypothetical protein